MKRPAPSGLRRVLTAVILGTVAALIATAAAAGTRPVTFRDLMAIRQIKDPVISDNGAWIACGFQPDRGNGGILVRSVVAVRLVRDRGEGGAPVRSVKKGTEYWVARGSKPVLTADGVWMAAVFEPTQRERDEAWGKKKDEQPQPGLVLLNTITGEKRTAERVESFAFSKDGRWLAWLHHRTEDETADAGAESESGSGPETEGVSENEPASADTAADGGKENLGALLVVSDLERGRRHEIPHVTAFAFDEPSRHLALAVAEPGGEENGLDLFMLLDNVPPLRVPLFREYRARCTHPVWAPDTSRLAFLAATDGDDGQPGPATLRVWEDGWTEPRPAATAEDAPEGWTLPPQNDLRWSKDGERLFFGFRPDDAEPAAADTAAEAPYDPRDIDALLADRELDVWSWDDPLIIPHQKKRWDKEKDRTYRAVFHRETGAVVPLADPDLPDIRHADNPRRALGFSDRPYRREITWAGRFRDVHLVGLEDGERTLAVSRLPENHGASLSPGGRFLAWYEEGHWHLLDAESGATRNLTAGLGVSFADEDHDYPSPPPGYGVAGWIEDDRAVLVYDKFDLWRFPVDGGDPVNLTAGEGRRERRQFRVVDLDPEREAIAESDTLLFTTFHEPTKNGGLYRGRADEPGVRELAEGETTYRVVAKAKRADRILYTRESYTEFPDLWVSDPGLAEPERQTDANPDLDEFAWGSAELVEWRTEDGTKLQGALIKPGNYEPGKRYPVVIYAYRLSSHRLHRFNEPVVNHRPSFPVYASHGYAVLLPDLRFEVGHPGRSATRALVAAARKLVDMGLADPDAIGLHGHSWGGYETAQVITETDVFAAAVAGAPVANMTSAYSGIRLESGLARQFQYEAGQSRIGASLDEALPLYLENSPVFHARNIDTPLLIQFGDADGAVPWQQGIELYLALRRLGKECHMLQYRGEPHHLQKYANKLDYSIKMMEFFDHHLKGEPAPAWMTEGVPYRGDRPGSRGGP